MQFLSVASAYLKTKKDILFHEVPTRLQPHLQSYLEEVSFLMHIYQACILMFDSNILYFTDHIWRGINLGFVHECCRMIILSLQADFASELTGLKPV